MKKCKHIQFLLAITASYCFILSQSFAVELAKPSKNIVSFKAECDDIMSLKAVERGSLRSVCAERKEIPTVVMGDEEFLFPETVIESLVLTKSYGEKYGGNQCPAPIRACYMELSTEFGKLQIIIASNNNRMLTPFDRLKKHSVADNTLPIPSDMLKKRYFADKLKEKPVKIESPTNGEFFVNKIITSDEGSPPITDEIYNAVVYVFSEPNNTNRLIISCSRDPKSDPLYKSIIMCRGMASLNDYIYYSYLWGSRGFDEIALFDQFKQAEKIIASYRVQSKPDVKTTTILPKKD